MDRILWDRATNLKSFKIALWIFSLIVHFVSSIVNCLKTNKCVWSIHELQANQVDIVREDCLKLMSGQF